MRRGLAGLLFFVAAIGLALAAGGWWLQRVAFDTSHSGDLADVVLEDAAIRDEITTAAADAAAATLGVPAADLKARIDALAQTQEGAALMRQIVVDSHGRLIGERAEPVQITADELVQLTRDQRAAALPPVTLPVEEVGVLATIDDVLRWAVPIAAAVGGVALLLGLVAHPRKADAVFGIGAFCILAAVFAVLLGWVVPVFLLPALDDSTWSAVIPAIAQDSLPIVVGAAIVLAAGGLALMIGAAAARRRRDWSSPVAINRYGDQRRWS
ncbi:MAG: hypothetical protein ABW328_17700 [Ilumatobacteraceae bacterium]